MDDHVFTVPAERLVVDLQGVRELLDEEPESTVATLESSGHQHPFGVDAVAQDLIDVDASVRW
ncbi:hypothetical protein [Streptomyces sp. NPDC048256]|uniref:hypothetical protein n=1 Tax=unclassified Streptomyces TaxID=2593676 RepID=UPI00340824BC